MTLFYICISAKLPSSIENRRRAWLTRSRISDVPLRVPRIGANKEQSLSTNSHQLRRKPQFLRKRQEQRENTSRLVGGFREAEGTTGSNCYLPPSVGPRFQEDYGVDFRHIEWTTFEDPHAVEFTDSPWVRDAGGQAVAAEGNAGVESLAGLSNCFACNCPQPPVA